MEIHTLPRMSKLKSHHFALLLVVTILLPFAGSAVDLISVPGSSFTPPASAGGDSYNPIISADGRYVAFNSTANNLAHRPDGAPYLLPRPQKLNVFLHDRSLNTTVLISADPADLGSGEDNVIPTGISTNGQFVLFEGAGTNFVTDDPTHRSNNGEIYLRDVINKTTTLVSVRVSFASLLAGCMESTMTPDARFVAFESGATNLVSGPTNGAFRNIFVRDTAFGQTVLASTGISGPSLFFSPEISANGKCVAFVGQNISINTTQDVYVCDLGTTNTFCVSSNSHKYISGNPGCYGQKISADGRYVAYQANVAFSSSAPSFVFRHDILSGNDDIVSSNSIPALPSQPLDMSPDGRFIAFVAKTNSSTGVFLWDAQSGTTTFVSPDTNGLAAANITYETPWVDVTGRFVSFRATGTGLVTNSVQNTEHIYRRDLLNGTTELVDAGLDGNATNRSLNTDFAMSSDGHCIAFDSPDADLVAQDGNNASDVFVRDLTAETTELASPADSSLLSQTGGRGDKRSGVHLSADGHFATFIAGGADLVSNYTNRYRGVFARDLVNQSNFVVSVDTNGLGNADASSTESVISGDGRYVAFTSFADNLVPNDSNHTSDVFLRDLQSSKTFLVSTNGLGAGSGSGPSRTPTLSTDGRFVTFFSTATNIVPTSGSSTNFFEWDRTLGPVGKKYLINSNVTYAAAVTPDGRYIAFAGLLQAGGFLNVYVWDSLLGQRIATNNAGSPAFFSAMAISTNGQWIACIGITSGNSSNLIVIDRVTRSNFVASAGIFGARALPHLSDDGRYLVYATSAAHSSTDLNGKQDVYLFDIQTRSNLLVSRSYLTGNAATGTSEAPDISADGRYIIYQSDAADIVPSDNNQAKDIFLFDRQSGSTMLLSAGIYGAGTGNFASQVPHFTGDGQTVAFQSWSSDLAPNDFNQGSDLFLLKLLNPANSTNPPPVLTGQIIYSPGSDSGSGQNLPQLTWAAAPGTGYQVQYKTNLTDDAWLPVNGSVVIEGNQGYVQDLAPDPDHRFYRIVGF